MGAAQFEVLNQSPDERQQKSDEHEKWQVKMQYDSLKVNTNLALVCTWDWNLYLGF